jgi:hypothetical protein
MKLEQGQIWKQGADYYRIVHWSRMAIQYKLMGNPVSKIGTVHDVSKKEFCRLIKGAELLSPTAQPDPELAEEPVAAEPEAEAEAPAEEATV